MNEQKQKELLEALKRIEEVTGQHLYSLRPDDAIEYIVSDLDPELAAKLDDLDIGAEEVATALADALEDAGLLEKAEIAWREAIENLFIREKST